MKPQSAKAKGRRFQQEVRDAILAAFPGLEPDDVRSTSMGASGADLLLSPAARRLFPFHVECKNVEALNFWQAYAQATAGNEARRGETAPLLVARRNRTPPLVVLALDDFLALVARGAS